MTKIDIFTITFDNEQAVYREGDKVTGVVQLETKEDIKLKAIRIDLCGIALVRWDHDGKGLPTDPDEKVSGDINKEQYFHKRITLLEKDGGFLEKDPILTQGAYTFPFEAKLPPELPSSFEGRFGQIRYLAKAFIERPWKSNSVTKKAFTVLSGLDLNFIPEAATKIELCKFKEMGSMCCMSGSVTIDWTVDRSGYVPGEEIIIHGAIQNESSENVAASKATLFMVVNYKSKNRRRQERHEVVGVEKGPTPAGDITVWAEQLHIPPIPPTALGRCRLIDVNYELQFLATFEGRYSAVQYNKDIYIGTVPVCRKEMKSCVAGMFNQPYRESTECLTPPTNPNHASQASLTQIIAAAIACDTPTNPTAPSLDRLETHQGSGDFSSPTSNTDDIYRPPPFAPGHQDELTVNMPPVYTTQPSAPGTQTLMRPDTQTPGLYPSLGNSMFGPVSIRESDDTESVRGDLTYTPIYPYYSASNQ